jgi:hypothetical protein
LPASAPPEYGWKEPLHPTPFESQNWLLAALALVATVDPLAIVPVTAWLVTEIEVAPAAAVADAVNTWPEIVTLEVPGSAALSAATGIEVTLPLRSDLVDVTTGSSGGLSSLLVNPPLMVNPLCKL